MIQTKRRYVTVKKGEEEEEDAEGRRARVCKTNQKLVYSNSILMTDLYMRTQAAAKGKQKVIDLDVTEELVPKKTMKRKRGVSYIHNSYQLYGTNNNALNVYHTYIQEEPGPSAQGGELQQEEEANAKAEVSIWNPGYKYVINICIKANIHKSST
jgi:hypothetical protein